MEIWSGCAERGVVVEVAGGTVKRDGVVVPLQFRVAELAVALAVQPHAVSPAFLMNLLFPERGPGGANVLNVYIYRLRHAIEPSFVRYERGGYRLGDGVAVDVAQARAAVERLTRSERPPAAPERERMLRLARGLRAEAPAALLARSWYDPLDRLARRLGRNLALLIARNALEHGEVREAMLVAEELTYGDACDEEAWEVLIRAQLLLQRRAAAVQSFRFYETALAHELAARPSPGIRRLVEDQRHAARA
jgi:DNA-binding SARP family transcriptional activator